MAGVRLVALVPDEDLPPDRHVDRYREQLHGDGGRNQPQGLRKDKLQGNDWYEYKTTFRGAVKVGGAEDIL